ncbi:MAG: hypothetical protein FWF54_09525 [Candidatus Azobacteroides sp.]|nr:hypothetical protein [Candidatus Azobacteroides sp.]
MKTRGFKVILIGLSIIAGFGAAVMLLWNALVPDIFGLPTVNFWQATGLLVLIRILFGGIGGRKMAGGGRMHGGLFGGIGKRNPIREKWMKMTPEERKEFIRKRHEFMAGGYFDREDFFGRGRFGHDHPFGTDHPDEKDEN